MGDLKRAYDADEGSSSSKLAKKAGGGDVSAAKTKRKLAGGSIAGAPPKGQDVEGNAYWELSKLRRVGISHFKNNTFINIREYYESAGQMRPGKKGISLSLDQYKTLVRAIPAINAELRNDGVDISDAEEDDEEDAGESAVKRSAKKTKAPKKANIEATSDEDEGDSS